MGRLTKKSLEWALLEYVALYGLTRRARSVFGGSLPNSLALEQEWATARISDVLRRQTENRQEDTLQPK